MRIPALVEMVAFMPSFTFPVDGHTVFVVQPKWGAYDTFCIYFNFKIVLNKFIRLADKLKLLILLLALEILRQFYLQYWLLNYNFFETAHGIII